MRFDSIKKDNNFKDSISKLKNKYTASVTATSPMTDRVSKLRVESTAPNVLQKQNITKDFKTLDISDFVNTVKNSPETKKAQLTAQASDIEKQIKQKEQEYNRANNYSNWDEKMKAKTNIGNELNSLRTQLDNTRTQIDKIAGNSNDKLLTPEQVAEYNKNAPISQKIDKAIKQDIPRTAEKVGRTAMDLLGSGLVGATNAVEGMADAAVGNLGALASGVTSGFGLAPNKVSDKIKERAERFAKFNFSGEELLEEKKNEGTGVYEPKILGVKVRDALNTISNMVTSATFGGVPGFITSAAGQNIEQALNDNQSLNRAVVYGDIAGAVEGLTEKMFDAVNLLGGGKFDKFIPKGAIGKLIGGSAGEAIEEVVSEGINPFLKYLTYEKGTYDMPSLVEYLNTLKESAWNGFVIGLIMKGGQDITSPQIREQYKEEIYTAVDKSNLPENVKQTVKEVMITPAQAQINQDLQNYRNNSQVSQYVPQNGMKNNLPNYQQIKGMELIKPNPRVLALPEGGKIYVNEDGVAIDSSNYVAPGSKSVFDNNYSVVNGRQVLSSPQNQAQTQNIEQGNATLPTQAEMAQNANMNQIRDNTKLITQRDEQTLQSAKLAGMTDMDIQKAKELNDMLRSGTRLKFYDPQNIPQGVDVSRATDANGFYMDGTLWINKNSEMKVERILGHELTHHVENDDLINTILDSNIFYDFLSEKGFSNTAEFKKYLKEKKGYKQEELTSEMVAHFAEEKLFGKEETINRLARENRTLAQKILNWISDLKTKIAGSSEAKELLRIENMYRKALDQARNVDTSSTDAQYSIAGIKGARNLRKNPTYSNIIEQYKNAKKLYKEGYDNTRLIEETGWYRDNKGNWKYEFSDEDMTLKENIKLDDKKVYALDRMLEHDILFEAYPQLRNYTVIFANIGNGNRAGIFAPAKIILLNPKYANTKATAEYELAHEIQHAIQVIEGFPGSTSKKNGGYAYYSSLGEIEARDVSERLRMLQNERNQFMPETAKENPVHEGMERYLQNRTESQRIQDEEYIQKQEAKEKIKEAIKSFFEKGGVGYDQDIEMDNNKNNTETQSTTNRILHNENIENKRLAGKEPAFSMPEIKEKQLKIILETNPMNDDYHVGIRNIDDIKTFDEVIDDDESFVWGDFSREDAQEALEKGEIKVYSSKEIKNGNFVSTSYNQARDYAGNGKVYSKIVPLEDVAWISGDEGQYAKVTENPDIRYSMNPVEVAKNPPNIETGLDQLKRTSRVKEGDTQSNFTRNIYNQSIFDDKFKDLALDDKNIRSYASISNKETLQEANDAINEQGQKWVDRFLDKPNGEMKATDIAGGFILMNRYQQAGDYESMIRVAEKLRKAGTQQGQTIQMFSVLGRMTPEGMTYYAQKELSKAYDEILKNKTQKWADEHADEFKLNDKDIEYIQRRVNQAARLPEGRDKYVLLGEIASRIQNKIPPQAGQGLKALARNSMLLNPKTMVRNILGNVVIVPNHIVSDFIGAGIDKAISKKTGVRTTGGFDVKALQGAKKGIYESFDDFRRKISTREMGGDRFEIGQGKNFYENHTGRFGETRNKINKALNGLDRVTGFLLETGDRPFYETWFINSLNNQMKLNNVTEPTAEMIEIATDEALQRTWQDNNSYTRVVKSVRDGLNKLNVKGYGLGDMVMPFVKTPANLTKAVIDFSPLGAINAALKTSQFNKDIGKGTATTKQQREVVKAWSQVITGTLGMAMLTALANAGVLTGGSDEDKDVRAFEQNILGIKPYSIKIGDKTYTYDWAQPLGTSAAMVADTVKSLKNAKDTEGKVAAILEGAQSGASVLLEQSFVSGIRNLFEEDNLINALIETGFNETSKFTPQFLSQLAQIQDDTARTSYVYNNIPQTALNKVKAKIPGLRQTLEPSVDVLGREVKTDNSVGNVMFNPANTAFARTTEGAEEMYRIYQATGDKATIAQVAPYYFNVGSEKIVLTPKQRTQYQKTIGKIASDGVENLLNNKAYKSLEDTDKAEILKDLYSYGTAIAKAEASTSYLLPSEIQKIKDSGMSPEEYILLKYISNLGGTKKDEKYNSLISAGYSQKETEEFLTDYKGYKFESTSKNTLPSLKQQTVTLPTLEEQKAKLKPLKK